MYHEDDTMNLPPIRERINTYPIKESNCGDDFSMVLLDVEHLGDTIIDGNIDHRGNIIMERRKLVLSSLHIDLHIGIAKYSN